MKKTLSLVLALVMVLALFAGCVQDPTPTDPQNNPSNPTDPSTPATPATYTYNMTISVFPKVWNPHTYEEATEGTMLDYLSDGFYTFDYNEDETGFQMVPSMVTDDHPIDVTSEYVGKFGIEEGDSKLVWKINLKDNLKWQNGDRITAYDYVESAKLLLNPKASNYRADTMYTGDVVIVGAEEYFKQGSYAYSNMISSAYGEDEYIQNGGFTVKEDGSYAVEGKGDVWFKLDSGGSWSSNSLQAYFNAGYFSEDLWNILKDKANDNNYVAVDATVVDTLNKIVAILHGCATPEDYAATAGDYAYREWQEFCFYGADMPEKSWDEVGIFALSETELVYVIQTPMDGFYLKYGMPSGYLVHIPTYTACESIDENGNYTNTYMTSVETSMSYGTYNMTKFQLDKEIEFEKSTTWHNLSDDTYQTTHINYTYVSDDSTKLQLLNEGKVDTYGLTATDFEKYGLSDYTYYSEGASTFAMTFNPDFDALKTSQEAAGENINKTIITLIEFRMAMSFGMNRPAFTAATDPAGVNAYGLFTNQHIIDPEAGLGYRDQEAAKDTLVEFWGLADEIGEGKMYADKDEAIASLTGYNPEQAKQLFNEAYDKAIAEGLMDADDVIEIKIGLPRADSTFYNNGYNFIVNNYTELVKGTKLEGKLTFSRDDTLGNAFADALKACKVDMLFGVGWSGMELNPYGLVMAYVDPSYQYDAITDFTTQMMTATINGVEYTASVYDWYLAINGETVMVTDAAGNNVEYVCGAAEGRLDERVYVMAQIEKAVLMNYNYIPLNGDAGANLKGMQIKYYHEEYMFGMGFGGIKYMTYNYTDAEWDAYVASMNGILDYT